MLWSMAGVETSDGMFVEAGASSKAAGLVFLEN
jgi:hypothetical protein